MQDRAQRAARAERDPRGWVAGRRHDRRKRQHPIRMSCGQHLRDHAAHRSADDMRTRHADRTQQGGRIVGHVVERIGRPHRQPQQRARDCSRQQRGVPPRSFDECPQSRLSKRITRSPAARSPSTKASGQSAAGIPRPMISRTQGASGGPSPRSRASAHSPALAASAQTPVRTIPCARGRGTASAGRPWDRTAAMCLRAVTVGPRSRTTPVR